MKSKTVRVQKAIALLVAMTACLFHPAFTAGKQVANRGRMFEPRAVSRFNSSMNSLQSDQSARLKINEAYGRSPLSFELCRGTADARPRFLSCGIGYSLCLTASELSFAFSNPLTRHNLHGSGLGLAGYAKTGSMREATRCLPQVCGIGAAGLRMKFIGANAAAQSQALEELPAKSNYFTGNDPKHWRTNIATYAKVMFKSVYRGVDVVYYGNRRQVEYDFNVAPGADYKAIRIVFEGAEKVRVNKTGELIIETSAGELRQTRPIIYQEAGGIKQAIKGGYVIRGDKEIGFELGEYDRSREVVIDPVLEYSAAIGGALNDTATGIAVDGAGNAYVTGVADSNLFPILSIFAQEGQLQSGAEGVSDVFVTKFSPSGALLYYTQLGGRGNDFSNAIAVDGAGNAYVTGYTFLSDFPTTPGAFQTTANNMGDAFVTKLGPTGNAIVYSTRLGGPLSERDFLLGVPATNLGTGIAVDGEGSAYITGTTLSESFPTRRAAQKLFNNGAAFNCCFRCLYTLIPPAPLQIDAFVTKLNPSGTDLVYSTYLGGTGQDEGHAIAVDSSGSAYVTGRTCSSDFTGATGYRGGASDGFLTKLSPSGRDVVYSMFIGGSGNDSGNGIAVDSSGSAYVTGSTASTDLQTTQGAFQRSLYSNLYFSTDGGTSWQEAAGLANTIVNVITVDPVNTSTIYAGLGFCSATGGVFKSTDSGSTWKPTDFRSGTTLAIAVDPKNPSIVYASSSKSTDGGNSWRPLTFPTSLRPSVIEAIAIDPVNTDTIYFYSGGLTCGDVVEPRLSLKSTDGGATWSRIHYGNQGSDVRRTIIDPKNPSTLYSGDGRFKSTDAGATWSNISQRGFSNLIIDPVNTSTLYASFGFTLVKSTDGGATWNDTGLSKVNITSVVVDPLNPSVLYAGTASYASRDNFGMGSVLKSTDGGQTWSATDLTGVNISTLAINPLNSSPIYAATNGDLDAFVVKSNPAGDALAYATYLGSWGTDFGAGIGVDEVGNAYITGRTSSDHFPVEDELQASRPAGPFVTAAFVAKLDPAGSTLSYSTYLGNNTYKLGSAIAVDGAGKVYVAGATGSLGNSTPFESLLDAFAAKIVSSPRITNVTRSGKHLIIAGEGFDRGAVVLIENVEQRTKNDSLRPATMLIARKAAKALRPGEAVVIIVRNSDRRESEGFRFNP